MNDSVPSTDGIPSATRYTARERRRWSSSTAGRATEATGTDSSVPVVAINPGYRPTDVEGLRQHGVEAVVLPDVGHFLMLEDPDNFNRLLAKTVDGFMGSDVERG